MDEYQCVVVDLAYFDKTKNIIVYVSEADDGDFIIETNIDGIAIKSVGYAYFEVFQDFRDKLLDLGYGLKCNGSRINAIQSAMMSSCEKIYLAEMGKQALNKDVVLIWDYAEINEFPNTDGQRAFANRWFNSK
ncbi:MAG: hypothetical protein K5776_07665 [Lachnospiraceae bacterium]|nr:hypothetical protein [Lachnospiraceae bacterium]